MSRYLTQLKGQAIKTDGVPGRTYYQINIELIILLFYTEPNMILKILLVKYTLKYYD